MISIKFKIKTENRILSIVTFILMLPAMPILFIGILLIFGLTRLYEITKDRLDKEFNYIKKVLYW